MKWCAVLLVVLLVGCGGPPAVEPTEVPTLGPLLSDERSLPVVPPTQQAPALLAPTATPTQAVVAADTDYRALIDAARQTHPYPESAEVMWQVMLCESSGRPGVEGPGGLIGLFQYTPSTWQGEWNPYRDQPITDARAQIYATAKAWSDGYQSWWSSCLP